MNATQTASGPSYWDKSAPWWEALAIWEDDQSLTSENLASLQKIREESEDRRIIQLCHFLLLLAADEAETIRRNDSFTQYLLKRRNARRLRKRFRGPLKT